MAEAPAVLCGEVGCTTLPNRCRIVLKKKPTEHWRQLYYDSLAAILGETAACLLGVKF
jgi:hypothetical protein